MGIGLDRISFLVELKRTVENTTSRVLLVSRDETDIRSQVCPEGARSLDLTFYEHAIVKSDVTNDIFALSKSIVEKRLRNKSESVKEDITIQMADKCEGMFLWIELQGQHLRGGKNRVQLQKIIREMPTGLEQVYYWNWMNILSLSPGDKARALNLLRWVTFAARPLTVSEVTEALLIVDPDDFNDLPMEDLPDRIDKEYVDNEIKGLCGSLIEVQSIDPDEPLCSRTIHLTHFSVKQYLLTTSALAELSDTKFSILRNQELQNNYLALTCLRYLMCKTISKVLSDSENTVKNHPFMDYAVELWHVHTSPTGERYSDMVHYATEFFKPVNVSWNAWRRQFERLTQTVPSQPFKVDGEATPCYYAAYFGMVATIDHLYKNDPGVINQVGGLYGTPIQAACVAGHISTVKVLFELGSNINIRAGFYGSALNAAVCAGHIELSRILLEAQNIDLLIADAEKRTPLYNASKSGQFE
ncbi:MAG: hypothetical protein Q9163_002923, partial [Psora crenata]